MRVVFFVLTALFIFPHVAGAQVVINEIMYDLEGSDTGREWIEIFNTGSEPVDLASWKLYENDTNHKIDSAREGGDFIISPGKYAVIADDAAVFFTDWPNFSGTVFDSSFSLKNTGENIIFRDSNLGDIDSVNYNPEWGANGDGNSLQKINGGWVVAGPTPGVKNVKQDETENSSENKSNFMPPAGDPNSSGAGGYAFLEPEIYASAGKDRITVAGAEIEFFGEAFNKESELLENVRYLWAFGDGGYKEGKVVKHTYRFPGKYNAILNVSSGKTSVSDGVLVEAFPNGVYISEVKIGADAWIELHNDSSRIIDMSFWKLTFSRPDFMKEEVFQFPGSTFILPGSYLAVPQSIFQFSLSPQNGVIKLLYSNNMAVDDFNYLGILGPGQTFSRIEEEVVITRETPGGKNKMEENAQPEILQVEELFKLKIPETPNSPEPRNLKNNADGAFSESPKIQSPELKAGAEEASSSFSQEANVFEAKENNPSGHYSGAAKWLFWSLTAGVISAAAFLIFQKLRAPT
ncbi:MAG: hypothetical protein A2909_02665 [Candidatus Tagabacteria bacterium RIFCSPLOWO2_01_FULL_39_11]|uniref:PKD domain-containing protein n=1 Tax=Candidatus Tagabacteria bacterium RIFCSPLOWO2_01_FULL_39_11 TaxID=1802295 RepID=A0A1G2LR11_9BACT|nr:MAG: hypothetical protein A2909_02665 [Candidatus Tagabacteria bacterium RIFCSPLOWO2_01_FULL_39_11]